MLKLASATTLSQQVNMGPIYFNQNTCSLVGQLLLQFQLQCPEKKKKIRIGLI